MSFEHLISGILANLIVEHHEKKKQTKAMAKETTGSVQDTKPFESGCENTSSLSPEIEKPDITWREKYQDNKAGLRPGIYDTEEDFLLDYNAVMECMHEEFMKAVRTDLSRLSEEYDLRMAAAMVYIGYKNLTPIYYNCAMKCLGDIMTRNGIDMETVISVAEQLDEAIEFCDKNPGNDRVFKISLL